mmetsp:Transcript_31520/g.39197  ORF Transcript_31520/g.39197 Transcript_31520/m.39197 type:complete len:246 (+) Transcript_31520:294-1031(+)
MDEVTALELFLERIVRVVERYNGEVLRTVDHQEALGHFCGSLEMHDDLGGEDGTRVDSIDEIGDRREGVSDLLLLLLLLGDEAQLALDRSGDGASHVRMLFVFRGLATLNQVARLHNEVNDAASLGCGVKIRVDLVRCVVVADSLSVALEVLINARPVEEHVGVGLRHLPLGLQVRPQGQIELLHLLIVRKEVREVRISQHVPRLRVAHVERAGLIGQLDTLSVISLSSLDVFRLLLAVDHGEVA